MSDIFNFDIKRLSTWLDEYGLYKTWQNILATHVYNLSKFQYLLQEKEFKSAKVQDVDILSGLSIGDIGVLYEYSAAYSDVDSRKSNGQFFTPDDVAIFMASFTKKFENGIWLDPCSGIGNLSWHLVSIQDNPEKFLISRMILSDRDELALFIARTLFTVSFQDKEENLFRVIEKNFILFDFLSVADNGVQDLFNSRDSLESIPTHDFVIVNPPYLATQSDSRFETEKAGDLYAYFLENIIKSSRGFISITPQSFTNAKKFETLRNLLLNTYQNITIFTFDNVPANIFKGIKFGSRNTNQANSIRAAIIVAIEGKGKSRITSLVRWRSSERSRLFGLVDRFLSEVPLTSEYFPKVSKAYEQLYLETLGSETLSSIISTKPTDYCLHVPSSPRYFITALKSPVQRASQKVLYFKNSADLNRAYMLINSSFMYWWWRVRDGGMTLSLETVLSLPLIDFDLDKTLIRELEKSEGENKVYKQNAGAPQENVKHPKKLIIKLNRFVIPDYSELLITLHENSEVSLTVD